MKKSTIYTKGGDKGETSLVSGERVLKSDEHVSLYGDVDELNAEIGLLISELKKEGVSLDQISFLGTIQRNLFVIGSLLACAPSKRITLKLPQLSADSTRCIEEKIDEMDSALPKLTHFIFPGGSIAASRAHLIRTKCRRVEREMCYFLNTETEYIPNDLLIYVNRLSDFFFVFARFLNQLSGGHETTWDGKS